jgi:flavodoxin
MNTKKVAEVIAQVLQAEIKNPQQLEPEKMQEYDLVGFGSGIDSGKHYRVLLDFADELQHVNGKKALIFSTSSMVGKDKVAKDHSTLRTILKSKGYVIVDEFACKGFNTNSFMKYLGGMNKGRPNADDLKNAEEFAQKLRKTVLSSI